MENTKEVGFVLNPLLEAQRKFSVIENRLFYLGLQDINPHLTENDKFYDEQFPDTHITPSELKKFFGYDACLTEIADTCEKFAGTTIKIELDDGFDIYTVFSSMKYRKGKGLFIKFNEEMRLFLLDIYKLYKAYGFTKLEMQQVFHLSSSYAMRLLELVIKYRSTAKNGVIEREISIEDLREKLNVPPNAYKGKIGNFKSRVLDLPIKDINENTQYFITYETVKKGRSVSGFRFSCNCNNVANDDEYTKTIESKNTPEIKDSPALPEGKTEEEKTYMKFIHYGFSTKTVKKLLEVCGGDLDELSSRLEYGEKRAEQDRKKGKKIPSISGYLRTAIEENWLGQNKDVERAKQREIEAERTNADWELWAKKEFSNEPIPDVPETPFENEGIEKVMINIIKKDIMNRNLCYSSKARLQEHGMTVARFIELYMEG